MSDPKKTQNSDRFSFGWIGTGIAAVVTAKYVGIVGVLSVAAIWLLFAYRQAVFSLMSRVPFSKSTLSLVAGGVAFAVAKLLMGSSPPSAVAAPSHEQSASEQMLVEDLSALDTRQHDSKGGFSIRPPKGWIVEVAGGFLAVVAPNDGFAPNITLQKGKFPTTVAGLERMARTEASTTPRKRIEAVLLTATNGTEIARVLTEKFHPTKGYDMRYTFYSIRGRHDQDFLFMFMCPAAHADRFQKLADAYLASFEEK